MASGPITSCEIDGETVETVSDFILGGSKITVDGDCSHEIKRRLLLGRKVMANLHNILKSRDITLSTKVRLVKAMVFAVVMCRCESWTIKKAERRRIDAFELWFWRKLLRVPWTARRSNQSILKEISPGCSLEGLMLKLKLQYFGHFMGRVDQLEKTLMLGGIGGRRRRGQERRRWMASLTQWTWVWVNSGSWWWTGRPGVLWFMEFQRVGHDWVTELNWTVISLLTCRSSLYILYMSPFLDSHSVNVFSQTVACLFSFLMVPLDEMKFKIFMKPDQKIRFFHVVFCFPRVNHSLISVCLFFYGLYRIVCSCFIRSVKCVPISYQRSI